MKHYIIILLTLLISSFAFSQENTECKNSSRHKHLNKEQVEELKVAFFTTWLELTTEESVVFWPLYNEYWEKRQTANRISRKSLNAVRKLDNEEEYNKDVMEKLLNNYIETSSEEFTIQKEYFPKFKEILPIEKVAKLYISEERFRMHIISMWRQEKKNQKTEQ